MDIQEIIKTQQKKIKYIIKKITNEENEDIEQEVYIKAWEKSNSYKEQGKLTGWIGTIAKNFSKDYLKSSTKKLQNKVISNEINENSVINTENPESVFIKKQRQKRIVKAIDSLKPKLKEVIMMYEIDGLSYEYIAKELNCPIGTVKSRLYNAKRELAQKLEDLL